MKKSHFFILLLFIFLIGLSNYFIISKDTTPIMYDGAGYFTWSVQFFKTAETFGFFSQQAMRFFLKGTGNKAPLIILAPYLLYKVFGPSETVAQMSNLIFVLLLPEL